MFGRRKPRRGPIPFQYVFIISFIIFILLTVQGLLIVNMGIKPSLLSIAESETQRIANEAITDAINKYVTENNIDLDDLKEEGTNTSGIIYFDAGKVNEVLTRATDRAQMYLEKVETGELREWLMESEDVEIEWSENTPEPKGVIGKVTLGQATGNALLANLGPEIPVQFQVVGEASSDLNVVIEERGINNTWIEIGIKLEVSTRVVIPFANEPVHVSTIVPVILAFVPGEVPQYYNVGNGNLPLSIPIEQKKEENESN
jgi:sporulation protein YunB